MARLLLIVVLVFMLCKIIIIMILVMKMIILIITMIIIITLFQEDEILGTDASLTIWYSYGPSAICNIRITYPRDLYPLRKRKPYQTIRTCT